MTGTKLACRLLALAAALCLAPPARAQAGAAPNPSLLTREALVATGRPTLHEALRELRANWVRFRGSAQRFPAVYVDQVRAEDEHVLQRLRPEEVLWVQYSAPAESRVRFDPLNRSGVIHVSTRLPLSAAYPATVPPAEFQAAPGLSLAALSMHGVTSGNRFESMSGTGVAVTLSVPVVHATVLLGSVQTGKLEGCMCGTYGDFERDADLLSAEAGVKIRGSRSRGYSPYVAGLLGVSRVTMRERPSVPGTVFSGFGTETGVSASLAAGVDLRLGSRVFVSPEARLSAVSSNRWNMGRLGSIQLGTTVLLGR
jgi:hypothetical protein